MSNPYVLRYSNPAKTETITVPSAVSGSGINNYDTSLDLVGPGYANYGIAYAQNFLKLLENFSSPFPPENAIEGQLWYDTSEPTRKTLRINNGTDTSSRWPVASGIYQQIDDPYVQYGETVKAGDIWVDTGNTQLKLRYGNEWRLVGPTISSGTDKTGTESAVLESTTPGQFYPVILNWVNGNVVEIISYVAFTPKKVIPGFTNLSIGVNITTKVAARYNGIATKADSLVYSSNVSLRSTDFLRNRLTSQTHTGTFIVSSNDGFYVNNPNYNGSVQINSNIEGASIFFNDDTKKFKIGLENWSWLEFDPVNQVVGINTVTSSSSPVLDVYGGANFNDTVTINKTDSDALVIGNSGNLNVTGSIVVGKNLKVTALATITSKLFLGSTVGSGEIVTVNKDDSYDLGSSSRKFRRIYASQFGTTASVYYGNFSGSAVKLATSRTFSIRGQVTTTNSVSFDGSTNVILTATITENIITDQTSTSTVSTASSSLLVYNSGLFQITKQNFLQDLYSSIIPRGSLLPWSTSTTSTVFGNFLMCDGNIYSTTGIYSPLYTVIGRSFTSSTVAAGFFQVPNVTTSLTTGTIYWIIKT